MLEVKKIRTKKSGWAEHLFILFSVRLLEGPVVTDWTLSTTDLLRPHGQQRPTNIAAEAEELATDRFHAVRK